MSFCNPVGLLRLKSLAFVKIRNPIEWRQIFSFDAGLVSTDSNLLIFRESLKVALGLSS